MQIIRNHNKVIHDEHGNAKVEEYYLSDKTIDLCIVHINGRVPSHGRLINTDYTCVCYVLNGRGSVCEEQVVAGDVFNILANEPYWFDGKFCVVMSGTPRYNPMQNKNIE